MKNCRPKTWYLRLIEKYFNVVFTCDHRCELNYDAPCEYPKYKVCNGDCNQGRLECNCDIKETK